MIILFEERIRMVRTLPEGWLLNVDYVLEGNKPVVRCWIKDDDGNVFVALDDTFEPYFYVLPSSKRYLDILRELLPRIVVKEKRIKRVEVVRKKNLGKETDVLKVIAYSPKDVPALRDYIASLEGVLEVREADIRFAQRYIIDKGLVPMGRILVEGDRIGKIGKYEAYKAERIEALESEGNPDLKILAFDCEMYNPRGVPNPERDPVILIGIATNDGKEIVLEADGYGESTTDRKLIRDFVRIIEEEDPDVIVGYNTDNFDWIYLRDRARVLGIELGIGRDGSPPKFRAGARRTVIVPGRLNVDLYRIAERDLDSVKIKTLENVAEHLGVMRRDERTIVKGLDIYRYWDDEEKREILRRYVMDDVRSALGIALKLLPMQYEFSRMIRLPLDEQTKIGRGRQVEWYLISEAYKMDELVPNKPTGEDVYEDTEPEYTGAIVLDPVPGIHENVICLDFASMYPNIMIAYNISPDTLCPECSDEEAYVAPEVKHKFRKSPDGFYRKILRYLVERRRELKKILKELDKHSMRYQLIDIQQKALKVLTNAFYGYMGWKAARWYRKECAEATTAWGRHMIKQVVSKAKELGITVLYGDTDSVFCKEHPRIDELMRWVNENLPVELEVKGRYKVIFFVGKKKRYAGLLDSDEIDVKGFEVRRGDWSELAKELQERIIETILREKSVEKAVELVRRYVDDVRNYRVPLEKLVIYKTLTKDISEYEARQAHVVAAKKAREHGIIYDVGSKIGFVIVRGGGSVSSRAMPVELIKDIRDIDTTYYIEKQIVPTAMRLLEYFGIRESDLKERGRQTTLTSFFT